MINYIQKKAAQKELLELKSKEELRIGATFSY
jgi:hypothetical protein